MDRPEKHVWGTLTARDLSQVYRAICGKMLVLWWLSKSARFTCGGGGEKGMIRDEKRSEEGSDQHCSPAE